MFMFILVVFLRMQTECFFDEMFVLPFMRVKLSAFAIINIRFYCYYCDLHWLQRSLTVSTRTWEVLIKVVDLQIHLYFSVSGWCSSELMFWNCEVGTKIYLFVCVFHCDINLCVFLLILHLSLSLSLSLSFAFSFYFSSSFSFNLSFFSTSFFLLLLFLLIFLIFIPF